MKIIEKENEQIKLDKKDTNKCEEYKERLNKQFGINIDSETCKSNKRI